MGYILWRGGKTWRLLELVGNSGWGCALLSVPYSPAGLRPNISIDSKDLALKKAYFNNYGALGDIDYGF